MSLRSKRWASDRPPFLTVGGSRYLDLAYSFGDEPIPPSSEEFALLVQSVPADKLLVAREMAPTEVAHFNATRSDIDAEIYGGLITKDEQRWTQPGPRRRR